ncbi:S1C family serine protease [Dendrosporobacter sp. 1207_IL3150]|uniref:S1C family serine protease n=1 Tax=Dendrosporobacter sp. 1207_IL3150 TaxID=3084054 RepID=UPI002FDB3925
MTKKLFIVTLVILFILSQLSVFAASKEWTSEEKLAKLTKPAVVRVWAYYYGTWTIGNYQIPAYYGGFGSGAFINPDGYIMTNAHVVDVYNHDDNKKWENLAWQLVYTLMENYNLPKEQAIALITQGYARLGKISSVFTVVTPGGEELPFDLKEIGASTGEKSGKDIAIIKVEGRNFPTLRLGDSDKVRTGERIFVAGYPSAGDLRSIGSKNSQLEWSWAPGSISSDKKSTAQGAPLIQVNAEGVTPGNSGGPVLNSDGQVIGLLTFYMNANGTLNGPLYCMASNTVQEYVRKAGATNDESLTDKAYREGLEFYWKGYYTKALTKFEEVKRLYAKHSEVESLIAECQKNIAEGNDKRYWPDYYAYLGLLITLVVAVSIIFIYLKRKKAQAAITTDQNVTQTKETSDN